jgi:hypothetical protein
MATDPGSRHLTRPFAAGAFGFAVVTTTADDRHIVEMLFSDLPEPPASDDPTTVFSLLRDDDGRGWSLDGPRLGIRASTTLDAALKFLLTAVNLCALDAEPEYLHLHAAAAIRDDRAVVIAAERDVGKTTTVAHLVARGWGFVTDETVRLSTTSDAVTGFPKPLSIKPGGHEVVAHLEAFTVPTGAGADGFGFVPVGASGATVARGGAPHLVILLRRPLGADTVNAPTSVSMHPADAVVALMQETLDAERFGNAAATLAELAAASHCSTLTVGTPSETAAEIEILFSRDPVEPLPVRMLPPSDAFSPGVVSVAVGDRTVVHDTTTGRIFALDEGAARVWSRLGGWSDDTDIDVDAPVIRPFVAQLRALGVLAGAA